MFCVSRTLKIITLSLPSASDLSPSGGYAWAHPAIFVTRPTRESFFCKWAHPAGGKRGMSSSNLSPSGELWDHPARSWAHAADARAHPAACLSSCSWLWDHPAYQRACPAKEPIRRKMFKFQWKTRKMWAHPAKMLKLFWIYNFLWISYDLRWISKDFLLFSMNFLACLMLFNGLHCISHDFQWISKDFLWFSFDFDVFPRIS